MTYNFNQNILGLNPTNIFSNFIVSGYILIITLSLFLGILKISSVYKTQVFLSIMIFFFAFFVLKDVQSLYYICANNLLILTLGYAFLLKSEEKQQDFLFELLLQSQKKQQKFIFEQSNINLVALFILKIGAPSLGDLNENRWEQLFCEENKQYLKAYQRKPFWLDALNVKTNKKGRALSIENIDPYLIRINFVGALTNEFTLKKFELFLRSHIKFNNTTIPVLYLYYSMENTDRAELVKVPVLAYMTEYQIKDTFFCGLSKTCIAGYFFGIFFEGITYSPYIMQSNEANINYLILYYKYLNSLGFSGIFPGQMLKIIKKHIVTKHICLDNEDLFSDMSDYFFALMPRRKTKLSCKKFFQHLLHEVKQFRHLIVIKQLHVSAWQNELLYYYRLFSKELIHTFYANYDEWDFFLAKKIFTNLLQDCHGDLRLFFCCCNDLLHSIFYQPSLYGVSDNTFYGRTLKGVAYLKFLFAEKQQINKEAKYPSKKTSCIIINYFLFPLSEGVLEKLKKEHFSEYLVFIRCIRVKLALFLKEYQLTEALLQDYRTLLFYSERKVYEFLFSGLTDCNGKEISFPEINIRTDQVFNALHHITNLSKKNKKGLVTKIKNQFKI